jgi:hypothetical protein
MCKVCFPELDWAHKANHQSPLSFSGWNVDVSSAAVYDDVPQVGRAVAVSHCEIEESPHSTGHGAEETSGWSNLSDRATETDRSLTPALSHWERGWGEGSKSEKVV